jgi:pimeloyl-ACP methyl ester carboxylesterase
MSQQKSMRDDSSIQLPDGRRLGYAEYGEPEGPTVMYFHAAPGSSHIHADMAEKALQHKVRLIVIDRPGYGLSTPKADRSLLSWGDDVAFLMDFLKISQFSVVGFSGGCPFALACARALPNRVKKVTLVAALVPGMTEGMPPMVAGLYALAQSNPDELRKTFAAVAQSPAALLGVVSATAGDRDKKVLSDRAAKFESEYRHALQAGVEGIASDYIIFAGNLGFPLEEVNTEVDLYTGALDENTPSAMTHALASQLPNSKIFVMPNEGHYGLYFYWDEILQRAT